MSTAELLEHLKRMSNAERLEVIEAATRLVRERLGEDHAGGANVAGQEEDSLRAAALTVKDLYVPGGEHTEWTSSSMHAKAVEQSSRNRCGRGPITATPVSQVLEVPVRSD